MSNFRPGGTVDMAGYLAGNATVQYAHRMTISWWIGCLLLGPFLILTVAFLVASNAYSLLSAELGLVQMLEYAAVLLLLMLFGVYTVAEPIVTRVVVKPQGIEYCTRVFVLCADWKDMVTRGYSNSPSIGRALVLIPRQGNLRLRLGR